MKAAILAVGTELSLGQITNRNASWLAARLHELGLFAPFHRVVPDDRALIGDELRDLAGKVEVLVLTGGLGPTTDDFTRECVAAFLGRPLVWDEDSWQWIQKRLRERGSAVREFQRQQCYYPEGAILLRNERGTAHGFRLETPERADSLRHVIVLPGPPAEVESAFENGVRPWLEPLKAKLDPLELKIWDCLGVGESDVAHQAEAALAGCPFEKAYRVHQPYVEFKLIYPYSRRDEAAAWCARVETALAPWIALRDGADAADEWMKAVLRLAPAGRVLVVDEATGGHFAARIGDALRGASARVNLLSAPVPATADDLELRLTARAADAAEAELRWRGETRGRQITAPFKAAALTERRKQFFMESALLFWAREIAAL